MQLLLIILYENICENRILDLMLAEKKKATVFTDSIPQEFQDAIAQKRLAHFTKDDVTHIVYCINYQALANALWHLISEARRSCSFIPEMEKAIGALLGYSSNEMDEYVLKGLQMFDGQQTSFPAGVAPHDGEELNLMLAGKKYIAMLEYVREEFEPYLQKGRFKHISHNEHTHIIYVSEYETEAQAFIKLLDEARKRGFVADLERKIGLALGYSEQDVQAYLNHISHLLVD